MVQAWAVLKIKTFIHSGDLNTGPPNIRLLKTSYIPNPKLQAWNKNGLAIGKPKKSQVFQ